VARANLRHMDGCCGVIQQIGGGIVRASFFSSIRPDARGRVSVDSVVQCFERRQSRTTPMGRSLANSRCQNLVSVPLPRSEASGGDRSDELALAGTGDPPP
jgi:hypothetical protein